MAPRNDTEDLLLVKGFIYQENNEPLSDAIVQAFDKDLRKEQLLGTFTLDKTGYYEISYTHSQFSRAEKRSADLLVRVFNPSEALLASSKIIFNAQPVETVNLTVSSSVVPVKSEYERYLNAIEPFLEDVAIADLREDEEHQDFTFLNKETEIPVEHLAFLAIAEQHWSDTEVPPDTFYGWFRQGLATDLVTLHAYPRAELKSILEAAIAENIIPNILESQRDKDINKLKNITVPQPATLAQPAILFHLIDEIEQQHYEESTWINQRLNQQLQQKVLSEVGPVSETLYRSLQTEIHSLDYHTYKQSTIAEVAETVLKDLAPHIDSTEETQIITQRLKNAAPVTVTETLQLDRPLSDNIFLAEDVRRAKVASYAELARLDNKTTQALLESDLLISDYSEVTLSKLEEQELIKADQKKELATTLTLGRLTGDNLAFVKALKKETGTNWSSLLQWQPEDWKGFIDEEAVPCPKDTSSKAYAETIYFSLDQAYPTQTLLARLLKQEEVLLLDDIEEQIQSNHHLLPVGGSGAITWHSSLGKPLKRLKKNMEKLAGFATTFRYLDIDNIINNKRLRAKKKKDAISSKIRSIRKFHENNPNLDLRFVDWFSDNTNQINWEGINEDLRPQVRKQLMAHQRVLILADETSDRVALMAKGYDSAISIVDQPMLDFVKDSGLPEGKAHLIYNRAQHLASTVSRHFGVLQEAALEPANHFQVNNPSPTIVNGLKDIDGFNELFGNQNYCDCSHCRSILSPAAYFVDLMHFIEKNISTPLFVKPNREKDPLYLKNRRSDLWHLKLTCEHTDTLVPYLTIVNEILEQYLKDSISEDGDIYKLLNRTDKAAQKISFSQPFTLPFEELCLYLKHFETSPYKIYRLLKTSAEKQWRARLNLSSAEFTAVVEPDPTGVLSRIGAPSSLDNVKVQDFINWTALKRSELDDLINLRFHPKFKGIRVDREAIAKEPQKYNEELKNLTRDRLDILYRFIKLWRKTPWSIQELDLLLIALGDAEIIKTDSSSKLADALSAQVIITLAKLLDLQVSLKLTVEELCAMVGQLPVSQQFPLPPHNSKDLRLYERLFDLKALFGERNSNTHALKEQLSILPDSKDPTTASKIPLLLAGLGVSETELRSLFDVLRKMQPKAKGRIELNRSRLSLLYRYGRLAKALKVSVNELISALDLNFGHGVILSTVDQIQILKAFCDWLIKTPFTLPHLKFILQREESSRFNYQTTLESTIPSLKVWLQPQKDAHISRLKNYLSNTLNLSTDHFDNLLEWADTQIDDLPDGDTFLEKAPLQFSNVIKSEVTISHKDRVTYTVRYKNSGKRGKAHIILEETLLGKHLKFAVPDNVTNTWKKRADYTYIFDVGTVDVGESGEVEFVISIDENLTLKKIEQEHNLVVTLVRVDDDGTEDIEVRTQSTCKVIVDTEQAKAAKEAHSTATLLIELDTLLNTLAKVLDLIHEIERVQSLFTALKLKPETVAFITHAPDYFGIKDLKRLTVEDLKALTTYQRIATLNDTAEPIVQKLLKHFSATDKFSNCLEELTDLWEVDLKLIESLVSELSVPSIAIEALDHIWNCLKQCQTLGINGSSLNNLAQDDSYDKLVIARNVALGAFSSRYKEEKIRDEKIGPYRDRINVLKRDALCNYILAKDKQPKPSNLQFRDRRDIYQHFLLDIEMSGCFRTSRLVNAISSLQLYVHRFLMNLEQSASNERLNTDLYNLKQAQEQQGDPLLKEWEWRKNYRVWEANRKVFLYPENYIEPDLRDNKTTLFKELEDELLQQKITTDTAETAYIKYMTQFSEVAHLKHAGSYYDDARNTYYFFGCTPQDPPQYYYRTWVEKKVWTPWKKIELAINSEVISATIHLGKLFIFWMEVNTQEKTKIDMGEGQTKGENKLLYYKNTFNLRYSFLNASDKWSPVQRIENFIPEGDASSFPNTSRGLSQLNFEITRFYHRVYSQSIPGGIYIEYGPCLYSDKFLDKNKKYDIGRPNPQYKKLNLIRNQLESSNEKLIRPNNSIIKLKTFPAQNMAALVLGKYHPLTTLSRYDYLLMDQIHSELRLSSEFKKSDYFHNLSLVDNRMSNSIFELGEQKFLIHESEPIFIGYYSTGFIRRGYQMMRLSTSLADILSEQLMTKGVQKFLSLHTQSQTENIPVIEFPNSIGLFAPYTNTDHIDFQGSYGTYYRELFFHIPFLIANHLNANQKFKEAKWWYERIFDPTASEPPSKESPQDRNWRYIEFRKMTLPKMRDILTDKAAIEEYKADPFNPHAIARLRMSAYQKAIVMKYIDNLLDWGDHLFSQDTRESIHEATMLYVLAADILGDRPVKLGKCKTASDNELTYDNLKSGIKAGSEFLIELENWSHSISAYQAKSMLHKQLGWSKAENSNNLVDNNVFREISYSTNDLPIKTTTTASDSPNAKQLSVGGDVLTYTKALEIKNSYLASEENPEILLAKVFPSIAVMQQATIMHEKKLAFCIPSNKSLLKYWDRVEDRLYKIRYCMNISGVRRELDLFQPSLDPMDLVRAKAAGISLEEILADNKVSPLHYRFSYLLEKARQFTQTVQNFGSALLSALEKKDLEELTRLRSFHELSIQELTRSIKKKQIKEALYQYQALIESKGNVNSRVKYYENLLNQGLTGWEKLQQGSKRVAALFHGAKGYLDLGAGVIYTFPQIGNPFAMKYGGKELGDSGAKLADWLGDLATLAESISSAAGLEATFQRRKQEWQQQLSSTQRELRQVEHQRLAAEIRKRIAEKELEIYEKNIEQTDELDEFYKDKFTNLGLYNYLSGSLNRLYREAYNMAYDMAKKVQLAYKFERDDNTKYIQPNNWLFDRAGLLAGERLLLQLQHLEKAYLDDNKRYHEITKHISLLQLNPLALIALRTNGMCEVELPEWLFNLDSPSHYMRRIKSISITIPCVTGPYTSVSCTLTLLNDKFRKDDTAKIDNYNDSSHFISNFVKIESIVTSTAQNDSGLFELNFRDERYLPFEGAGVISRWRIELPSEFRQFNYDTISDVILHLRYTAREGRQLKDAALNSLEETVKSATEVPLARLFSAKHEFPSEWRQFLHPKSGATHCLTLPMTMERFPILFRNQSIQAHGIELFLTFKDVSKVKDANGKETVFIPLDEYANGDPIQFQVKEHNASDSAQSVLLNDPLKLESIPQEFNGIPHGKGDFEASQTIGLDQPVAVTWLIEAANVQEISSDLLNDGQLLAKAIDDLIIICHYSVD